MATINIGDEYLGWVVENIEPLFAQEDINFTESARLLMAFALQAQIADGLISDNAELFGRADRLSNRYLVDHYKERYGDQEMDFNRALHTIDDLGIIMKYPWTTTGTISSPLP